MGVMKYKDPETGEVKKVFAPTFDAYGKEETYNKEEVYNKTEIYSKEETYNKSETDMLLAGKAPAGYGLGEKQGKRLNSADDLNSIRTPGWYWWSDAPSNAPFSNACMLVYSAYTSECYVQEVHAYLPSGYTWNVGGAIILRQVYVDYIGEWEWVNPPMESNVMYRTTDRFNKLPVYKKVDANGVIWWSTDNTNWKREAEFVGAATSDHTHSNYAASSHNHAAGDITSGTLSIARGGTGVTANPSMLTNLGSTSAASVFAASPRPGVTGTLSVANGGTGKSSVTSGNFLVGNGTSALTEKTPAQVLSAIGAAASNHTHSNYAASSHTHDDRYYTESEVNSLIANVNSSISKLNKDMVGKAPAYSYGTSDLTAGSSSLSNGVLYFVYE